MKLPACRSIKTASQFLRLLCLALFAAEIMVILSLLQS